MSASLDLLTRHRPDDTVAFGAAGTRTAADLLADAARLALALPAAAPDSHVLLVFEQDRYQMAAALLAALHRGHAVALPPTTRIDSILAVQRRPETVAMLHDLDVAIGVRVSDALSPPDSGEPSRSPISPLTSSLTAPFRPHAGVMATVFTSGTTGPMVAWRKTRAELIAEALWLGRTFDVGAGDRIVGTVALGHIYGLLFTVLLPLLRGAAFSRETPHHAEAIARCVREGGARVLVTVPVQLRACSGLAAGSLDGLDRIFSSTGPLPDSVAKAFVARHGTPVTEILGSTETGGIAYRIRDQTEAPRWRPFDVVRVSVGRDDRLCVDSPFLQPDLPRPFETADRVEMAPDGTFTHLGRVDGIVKIGGRRVSLSEVEACLREHPSVEDAAVVAVPDGVRGDRLLAAVTPASCPVEPLRQALLERFEPTCLPRRILAIGALPVGPSGKLARPPLLRLFGLQEDGRPFNWKLDWDEPIPEEKDGMTGFAFPVRVPEDSGWFEGHFEGYPILAGAAQLKELVLPAIDRAFPGIGRLRSMSRLKFSGRITPGSALVVRVSRGARPERVVFAIERQEVVCSWGALIFEGSIFEDEIAATGTPSADSSVGDPDGDRE